MNDWKSYLEMGARLLPDVIDWIVELTQSGDPDPMGTVRKSIQDRTIEIANNRAARDAQLRAKHGIDDEPEG